MTMSFKLRFKYNPLWIQGLKRLVLWIQNLTLLVEQSLWIQAIALLCSGAKAASYRVLVSIRLYVCFK